MSDLLASGAAWLAGKLASHAATSITYRRGASSVSIFASFGRTVFEVVGNDNAVTRFTSRDFLFAAGDLDFGSGPVDPRRNDLVTATIAGVERTFQVLDVNGVCFSKDAQGVMLRVHTKEIS